MQTEDNIPPTLATPAQAAVRWMNDAENSHFELTGLVDYDRALQAEAGEPYEFGLILCDGEICAREQIRVELNDSGYQFSRVALETQNIPTLLDPPVGLRKEWLHTQLENHEFILLLFYRGRW